MLRLEHVARRYPTGTEALADISLSIAQADFLALLGPSGCGKSTLLRLIAGLDQPDAGRLTWQGGAPPAPGDLGMVFQEPVLLPWASAAANAGLPLRLRGQTRADATKEGEAGLAEVGLAGFEHARPGALSGGMRMRVALARALSTRPGLLLMDEPFAALDEPTRHKLQDDLRRIQQDRACTIVFVTHSIYEAAYLATRIALMSPRPGRITEVLDIPRAQHRMDPGYLATVAAITAKLPA